MVYDPHWFRWIGAASIALLASAPASTRAEPPAAEIREPLAPSTLVPARGPALASPEFIPVWHDGEPIPPGYRRETSVRKGLVVAGATVFGTMHMLTVLMAVSYRSARNDDDGWMTDGEVSALVIPVVGPLSQIGHSKIDGSARLLLLADGLLQAGGMTLLVCGFAFPRARLNLDFADAPVKGVTLTPLLARGVHGLGVTGSF